MKSFRAFVLASGLVLGGFGMSPAVANDAETLYKSMSTKPLAVEFSVDGYPAEGVSVLQKDAYGGGEPSFCRESTVIYPNAKPTYKCFYLIADGEKAEETFKNSVSSEQNVTFSDPETGSILVGSSWHEKQIRDGFADLCVATAPVIPHPRKTYTCYSTEMPDGGGVSGSN